MRLRGEPESGEGECESGEATSNHQPVRLPVRSRLKQHQAPGAIDCLAVAPQCRADGERAGPALGVPVSQRPLSQPTSETVDSELRDAQTVAILLSLFLVEAKPDPGLLVDVRRRRLDLPGAVDDVEQRTHLLGLPDDQQVEIVRFRLGPNCSLLLGGQERAVIGSTVRLPPRDELGKPVGPRAAIGRQLDSRDGSSRDVLQPVGP